MHDCEITLFNYREDTQQWHTTLFSRVTVHATKGSSATPQGVTNGDTVSLHIPVTCNNGTICYQNKPYMKPKAYAESETPADGFTFTPGTDFFAVGDYNEVDPIDDAEYMDGLYSCMNAEHDDVYMISSAAFFQLIPHFEIGGR